MILHSVPLHSSNSPALINNYSRLRNSQITALKSELSIKSKQLSFPASLRMPHLQLSGSVRSHVFCTASLKTSTNYLRKILAFRPILLSSRVAPITAPILNWEKTLGIPRCKVGNRVSMQCLRSTN